MFCIADIIKKVITIIKVKKYKFRKFFLSEGINKDIQPRNRRNNEKLIVSTIKTRKFEPELFGANSHPRPIRIAQQVRENRCPLNSSSLIAHERELHPHKSRMTRSLSLTHWKASPNYSNTARAMPAADARI